jgi:predicted O-methyltransferase YrrM
MEHFDNKIQGWNDGIPPLYAAMVKQAINGMHFVEVGSWKGKSASFMAVEIINSGKSIKFDCVDTWLGDAGEGMAEDPYIKSGTLFEHFLDNMKPVEGYFTPIRESSVKAAELYEDNSLDFVFIDAAHDYDNVFADVHAWWPKVKEGGIISGHDYYHPPVRQAVNECLHNVEDINGCCWLVRK